MIDVIDAIEAEENKIELSVAKLREVSNIADSKIDLRISAITQALLLH